MSKPDPAITANLLGSLNPKPLRGAQEDLKPARPGHAERHPAPAGHASARPAPAKQALGRTRTSNRGK